MKHTMPILADLKESTCSFVCLSPSLGSRKGGDDFRNFKHLLYFPSLISNTLFIYVFEFLCVYYRTVSEFMY